MCLCVGTIQPTPGIFYTAVISETRVMEEITKRKFIKKKVTQISVPAVPKLHG